MTKEGIQKAEARPPHVQSKLDELAARGDMERLQLLGQVIGVVSETVKAGGAIIKLREQQHLVDKEIEKLQAEYINSPSLAQEREKTTQLRERAAHYREVVREFLPSILGDLGDVSPDERAQVTKAVLGTLPKV